MDTQGQEAGPLDAMSSASHWVKVAKKQTNKRGHLYWFVGGLLTVMMVLSLSSHRETEMNKETVQTRDDTNYSAALNANLARLNTLANQKSLPRVNDRLSQLLPIKQVPKEYLARQHSPTSLYSASVTQEDRQPSDPMQSAVVSRQRPRTGMTDTMTTLVEAQSIPHPGFTIAAGEFLHAILETAINSDLPGMVRAVISDPVYAYTGGRTIIPAGSRLIGQYSAGIIQGQNRVMIIWNRLMLPNGMVVQINSPGTDNLGRAGQGANNVNPHFFARFGESVLLSLIGAGAATAGVHDIDQANSASQYRMAIAQSFQQSAAQSLQGSSPMKPTIHVYQGTNLNVFVTQDISFYSLLRDSVV